MYDHFQNTRQPTQGEGKIVLSADIRCPAARVIYSAAFVIEIMEKGGPRTPKGTPGVISRMCAHSLSYWERPIAVTPWNAFFP